MNLIKNLGMLLLGMLILISCNQQPQLTCVIDGLGDNAVVIAKIPVSKMTTTRNPEKDTVVAKANKFVYPISIEEPTIVQISFIGSEFKMSNGQSYYPDEKKMTLLLNPSDKIKVTGKLHEHSLEFLASGNEFNSEYSQLRNNSIAQLAEAVKIVLEADKIQGNDEERNKLYQKLGEIKQGSAAEQTEYVKNNPDKGLTAFLVLSQSDEIFAEYYEKAPETIKTGLFQSALENRNVRYLHNLKLKEAEANCEPGKPAPRFLLTSIDGSEFTLDKINNKYIVLDFWGKWCIWCMRGMPRMKEYYSKYSKKLEIVGIDCGDSEDTWKKTVEELGLKWTHVINDKAEDKDATLMYGIRGFPSKYILDKDKNIVAKFVGESDEFYNKLDELLK